MKASDLFLQCLENLGVDTIFGVPGEENADLMISLLDSPIEFVVCRHEQTAAFMAGMHGHLTGKPGVCLATLGPGSTNLITGVANSNMDRYPLIAILGQASTHRLHKESHQNMDAVDMYKPVSKWATTIREADVIPEIIAKAYKVATEPKPGAVIIELPEDIAKLDTDAKPLVIDDKRGKCPTPEDVDNALELIAHCKSAVLLVGGGCVREECDEEIKTFLDKTGIYCASTFMGKGAADARHEQSLYCVGLGMKDIALKAFNEADLIISVGFDIVEWAPDHWNENSCSQIIHVDTIPAEVDKDYIPQVELIGDVKHSLHMLNSRLSDQHKKNKETFVQIRQEISDDIHQHDTDDSFPMKPQRILHDLRTVMRDDDVLFSDVGAHKMWVARQYPTYLSKTCFISNGFCSMGFAMPSAFACKRLNPNKNIVALCGDGGFIMSIQAIPTAVRYSIPFTVLVWEDDYYGLIKWKQEAAYDAFSHVKLDNPDLVEVASAFGCHAQRVNSAQELISALESSFAHQDKPSVIVVPVDYSENMKLTKHLGEILSR